MARKGKSAMRAGGTLKQHRTRSRYPIADDPITNERELTKTLASLGLYAANTLGDGNCLFRALADQYYGDPKRHDQVRADVCNYLEAHASYFQNYVLDCEDDDLAAHFSAHILAMRRLGTYGDDMELTAFSKMTGREIRVVQPGLVYVVADESPTSAAPAAVATPSTSATPAEPITLPSAGLSPRERRRAAREAKGKAKEQPTEVIDVDEPSPTGALWICYHSYEHYSSARNVAGPHSGLPNTVPRPVANSSSDGSTPSLTDDSDDASSSGSKPATVDERLLLSSLPQPSPYGTLPATRALIAQHGSWEAALEAAQEEALRQPLERKRSASPTPPDGSSPRQRVREDSDSDTSETQSTDEDAIAEAIIPSSELVAPPRPLRGRPKREKARGRASPLHAARETRAKAKEREAAKASHPLTRLQRANRNGSDVSVSEGIRTLRV